MQLEKRDLITAMDHYYNLLGYTYETTYNCYYGMVTFFNTENLLKLWTELDIIKNFLFNLGYIYTDIVMLAIGVPGQTEADYMYYLFFYIGDYIFRFFFRDQSIPHNCWYPWNFRICSA